MDEGSRLVPGQGDAVQLLAIYGAEKGSSMAEEPGRKPQRVLARGPLLAMLLASAVACCACGAQGSESDSVAQVSEALSPHDFDVDFTGCTELAGIGFVPAAKARSLVPAHYTLAGDATNAVLVARAVKCAGVAVDGHAAQPTTLTQIGISLVGPDSTADINNYTLWYVTDQALLAAKLNAAGADAENSPHLSYTFLPSSGGGTLDMVADPARAPHHELHGPVVPPNGDAVPFTASWWADGNHGTQRMRTVLPNIRFGTAHMTLTTPAGSALASVIGGTSLTFALLDSYNAFDAAHMEVRAMP